MCGAVVKNVDFGFGSQLFPLLGIQPWASN